MASQWKIDVVIANRYTRSFELTPTIALDAVLEVDESDVTPGPYHGHRISAEAKYKAAYDLLFPAGDFKFLTDNEKNATIINCANILLTDAALDVQAPCWLRGQSHLLLGYVVEPEYGRMHFTNVRGFCNFMKEPGVEDESLKLMEMLATEATEDSDEGEEVKIGNELNKAETEGNKTTEDETEADKMLEDEIERLFRDDSASLA